MPIAITPGTSRPGQIRAISGVARRAFRKCCTRAWKPPSAIPAVLAGGGRTGPAWAAPRGVRRRARIWASNSRSSLPNWLRRGTRTVRALGDRQRAHRRPRSRRQAPGRVGFRRDHRELRPGVRPHPQPDTTKCSPYAVKPDRFLPPPRLRCWCFPSQAWTRRAAAPDGVVLDADSLEIEPVRSVDPLRPVAHVRANAVDVGLERVLSSLSPPPHARSSPRSCPRRPWASPAGQPTRRPHTRRSANNSAGRSASSRPSSTSVHR